ncbi:hypothetical protein SHPE106448_10525 [Shewanella pealeana]
MSMVLATAAFALSLSVLAPLIHNKQQANQEIVTWFKQYL